MKENILTVRICDPVDAAATKPFGFILFYPGPGLGGYCIPIDQPLTPEPNNHLLTPEEEAGRLRNEMRARGESVFDRDVLPEFALG